MTSTRKMSEKLGSVTRTLVMGVGGDMSWAPKYDKKPYRPKAGKTKFLWRYWQWTEAEENLFCLNAEQLAWFILLVEEQYKQEFKFSCRHD